MRVLVVYRGASLFELEHGGVDGLVAVRNMLGAQLTLQVRPPAGSASTRGSGTARGTLSWSFPWSLPRLLHRQRESRRRCDRLIALIFLLLVDDVAVVSRVIRLAAIIFLLARMALGGTSTSTLRNPSSSCKVPRATAMNAQLPR